MRALDIATRMKVTDALTRASMTGRDAAEYLHSYGLLASDEWRRKVQAEAIASLAERWMAMPNKTWQSEQVAKWLTGAAEAIGGTGNE